MVEVPQFESPQAEFEHITERVMERRDTGNEAHAENPKEDVRVVLRDHVGQVVPVPVPQDDVIFDIDQHDEQIRALVEVAFSRGIAQAVTLAKKMKNPHILDEFHDVLTDHFYDRMSAMGFFEKNA